jgi:hypothetical protein
LCWINLNIENSKSIKSNTGYKGIYFDKERGQFEVQVSHKSLSRKITKSIYVGLYETLKEAVKAREDFIKSLF